MIRILDVFPGHFDQNGDSGNVLALRRRLEWSGFDVTVDRVDPGDDWATRVPDFVVVGGGSIPAQRDALPHLVAQGERIAEWIAAGSVYLAVAGGYALSATEVQLPGETSARAGIGVFAGRSAPTGRLVSGPIAFRSIEHGVLHGYVNLAQRVQLADVGDALGSIEVGPWSEPTGAAEGAQRGHAYGTHAHGPIVPKNPRLADAIIRAGLARLGIADRYRPGTAHARVDELARRARASLAARLRQPPPD